MTAVCLLFISAGMYAEGIDSTQEFLDFAAACNAGASTAEWSDEEGVVILNVDIDLAKAKKFTSITSFGGIFDGQGHSIRNWKARNGLFRELLEGGKIMNLRIDASCEMRTTTKRDGGAVGFIADVNNGIIENCENHGDIRHMSGAASKNVNIGGITGVNNYVVMNCRNCGNIDSQAVSSLQQDDVMINIGGIAGIGSNSRSVLTLLARNENTGKISYSGDFVIARAAGIVGTAYRQPVKYCVNRGDVDVTTNQEAEVTSEAAYSELAGGIVCQTRSHVVCCDNFGSIVSSGKHSAFVGGICAMPHGALVIGDCMNYGPVRVCNETACSIGGIAGSVGRAVHIRGCINRGDVSFEGVSYKKRSNIGGIVGNLFVKKDATEAAYVRNCANYGNVSSGACSNAYMNHDRAIHTGGVAGWMSGSVQHNVVFRNCSNFGTVKAEGGRKGNLYANGINLITGGEYDELWAESAEPVSDGSNVFGRITTPDGQAVPGVVVSDGFQCVTTDGFGYYSMVSDLDRAKFVYISLPAYYKVPHMEGVPSIFRRIARHEKAVMADFVLTPAEKTDKYTVMMVADPQMRPYGVDGSAETYRDSVAPDIAETCASIGGDCYMINLGDLVYNYMHAYDDYMDITAQIDVPVFNVIGNHDYDQTTMFDSSLGTMFFETYAGPVNYSFNIGKIHYVVVNDIIYNRTDTKITYRAGLEDSTLRWLEDDLKYIPDSSTIVLCAHSQMFKKKTSHSSRNVNHENYLKLLRKYRQVYSWAGHNHENYSFNYEGKGFDRDNIYCVLVARATGSLRLNKYLGQDGTPQGYMVMDVDGEDISWYYKSVGRGKDYQMKVYSPMKADGLNVTANIWNYGDGWSKAEWWENGVKVCDMEQFEGLDPDYEALFATVTNEKAKSYCKPLPSPNMFRAKPSDNCSGGEVRVTDNFGNIYISKISW